MQSALGTLSRISLCGWKSEWRCYFFFRSTCTYVWWAHIWFGFGLAEGVLVQFYSKKNKFEHWPHIKLLNAPKMNQPHDFDRLLRIKCGRFLILLRVFLSLSSIHVLFVYCYFVLAHALHISRSMCSIWFLSFFRLFCPHSHYPSNLICT